MTTYFSIANMSNWCTSSLQGPSDVAQITLGDTPTRCTGYNVTKIVNAMIVPIANVVILY